MFLNMPLLKKHRAIIYRTIPPLVMGGTIPPPPHAEIWMDYPVQPRESFSIGTQAGLSTGYQREHVQPYLRLLVCYGCSLSGLGRVKISIFLKSLVILMVWPINKTFSTLIGFVFAETWARFGRLLYLANIQPTNNSIFPVWTPPIFPTFQTEGLASPCNPATWKFRVEEWVR